MQQLVKFRIVHGIITVLVTIVVGCTHEERNRSLVDEPSAVLAPSLSKQPSEVEFHPVIVPSGKHPSIDRFKAKRAEEELTDEEQKELRNLMEQYQEAQRRLNPTKARIMRAILKSTTSWQEANREVREQIASIAQDPYAFELEQFAAHQMLSKYLLRGEEVPEKKDAIAYYTELLLRNEYPDAEIISNALEALEGKWTRSQIARAAAQTAKHAREYLKQNPCKPCLERAGIESKKVESLLDAKQRKLYRMQNSLPNLDKLAKRES